MVECWFNVIGDLIMVFEVVVKVDVDGQICMLVVEGNGLVNVLDMVLCKDFGKYQEVIEGFELIDYKVCIFNGGIDVVM